MKKPFKIEMIYKGDEIQNEWVIYNLRSPQTADIEYIGMCLFTQSMGIPDARANVLFKNDTYYIFQVTDVCNGKAEALKAHSMRMRENGGMPSMNKCGYFYKRRGLIQCIETGETFQTIHDAARVNQCAVSNLSNHLNNKPGFRSVKGKTFKYLVDKVNAKG